MKDIIQNAYKVKEGLAFFESLTSNDFIDLSKSIDYVYNLLEKIGVVDVYSGHEILKDFCFRSNWSQAHLYLVENPGVSVDVDMDTLIDEVYRMHKKV